MVAVAGELDAAGAEGLLAGVQAVAAPGRLALDLSELELTDGVAVAIAVDAVRVLAATQGAVELRAAPQMLAHTLYKCGLLSSGQIALCDPRVEEPTTAN